MAANGMGFFGAPVPEKGVSVENTHGACYDYYCDRPI
jgi:hypothetical protein